MNQKHKFRDPDQVKQVLTQHGTNQIILIFETQAHRQYIYIYIFASDVKLKAEDHRIK